MHTYNYTDYLNESEFISSRGTHQKEKINYKNKFCKKKKRKTTLHETTQEITKTNKKNTNSMSNHHYDA